jgi:hypothetical protein
LTVDTKEEGSSATDFVADVADGLFAIARLVEEDISWKKEEGRRKNSPNFKS